ncbi:hypothetical protein [Stutzerimonas nitrititolerans]|uniref:hypothetical protein n=1 Tax=Stutzerimonas nitrititolerans TaxID=2482751 RepID=UPI00289A8840|nr:hypothetical protein [Stutzerimonas nitrititolerans]
MSIYQDLPLDLIDQFEAAEIIGVAVGTLKTWRSRNPGLGYYQGFGREIRYSLEECKQYRHNRFRRIVPKPKDDEPDSE